MKNNVIDLSRVGQLYSDNIKQKGITPESVGWTKPGSQQLRFAKLLNIITTKNEGFSLNEIGCGYGEVVKYCSDNSFQLDHYYGYDISPEMLEAAKEYTTKYNNIHLYSDSLLHTKADYSITSGIFNVKFDHSTDSWEDYIRKILINMAEYSNIGFSFNMLTSYVDWEEQHLYYGNPLHWFDFCKKNISKKINLAHDYDLWEFTIGVTL